MNRVRPVIDTIRAGKWTQEVTVLRFPEAVDDQGRVDPVGFHLAPVPKGVVQPATDEEVQRLPEAERTKETIKFYTTSQLTAGNDDFRADEIVWRGKTYRVVRVKDYGDYGYWVAFATLADVAGKEITPDE